MTSLPELIARESIATKIFLIPQELAELEISCLLQTLSLFFFFVPTRELEATLGQEAMSEQVINLSPRYVTFAQSW